MSVKREKYPYLSYEMSYNTNAHNSKANYTRVQSENRSKIDIAVRNLRIAPGEHQAYISVKRDEISISII